MLALPEIGVGASSAKRVHPCDVVVICDWIEGSLLFGSSPLSKSDICDVLEEQAIYQDQAIAMQFLDVVWLRMERRAQWLGDACSYEIQGRRVSRRGTWQEFLPNSYLLMLSFIEYYAILRPKTKKGDKNVYIEQGKTFEIFCHEALRKIGWDSLVTGWSSGAGAKKLPQVVDLIANTLSEGAINKSMVGTYAASNEEGCDLVCHRPFPDKRGGRPVYLVQCASGVGWQKKCHTPDMELWAKFIAFSQRPQRAFCLPKALEDDAFLQSAHRINGMVVDRYRLLHESKKNATWMSGPLVADITKWVDSKRAQLPQL